MFPLLFMHLIYKIATLTWLGLPRACAKSCLGPSPGSQGHFCIGIFEMCMLSTFQRRFRARCEVYCCFLLRQPEKLEENHGCVLNDKSSCPSHRKPRVISSRRRLCVISSVDNSNTLISFPFGILSEVTCQKSNTRLARQWWESGILNFWVSEVVVHWLFKDLTKMSCSNPNFLVAICTIWKLYFKVALTVPSSGVGRIDWLAILITECRLHIYKKNFSLTKVYYILALSTNQLNFNFTACCQQLPY